mmetsp:Transcript_52792/g.104875  ORF Transcript_52792/g.104875 Transcript_52792/m.104875 type:complete len:120 (-) Transcript_52792:2487-2846(-)
MRSDSESAFHNSALRVSSRLLCSHHISPPLQSCPTLRYLLFRALASAGSRAEMHPQHMCMLHLSTPLRMHPSHTSAFAPVCGARTLAHLQTRLCSSPTQLHFLAMVTALLARFECRDGF